MSQLETKVLLPALNIKYINEEIKHSSQKLDARPPPAQELQDQSPFVAVQSLIV